MPRCSRGRYDEAEQLFLEVVEGQQRMFGDDHAKMLKVIASLASTYVVLPESHSVHMLVPPTFTNVARHSFSSFPSKVGLTHS
jgi:hypothetical protein